MLLSILGFFLVIIVCLVMGRSHYHPTTVIEYRGSSGWGPGLAWLMSIGVGQFPFAGISACTHIAEEMPRPGRRLPHVMLVLISPFLQCFCLTGSYVTTVI